jgi:hypothetical protein
MPRKIAIDFYKGKQRLLVPIEARITPGKRRSNHKSAEDTGGKTAGATIATPAKRRSRQLQRTA